MPREARYARASLIASGPSSIAPFGRFRSFYKDERKPQKLPAHCLFGSKVLAFLDT
jgi:hypothetical protein